MCAWREVFWFSYQSSFQEDPYFQFYYQTTLFHFSTLLQKLPQSMKIRKTYVHGIFHYPDLWIVTDLVNNCSENGEHVNYRIARSANISNHCTPSIFKTFMENEKREIDKNDDLKKKSKIKLIQNELKYFITQRKYEFKDLELSFVKDDQDFNQFLSLVQKRFENSFFTCETNENSIIYKTNVSQYLNQKIQNEYKNK